MWPFSSTEDVGAAAGILGALLIALIGWLGTRLYYVRQRNDLLAHLGIEIVSNAHKLELRVGIPVIRTAWSDHRARGLFKWTDITLIEAAYTAGDSTASTSPAALTHPVNRSVPRTVRSVRARQLRWRYSWTPVRS